VLTTFASSAVRASHSSMLLTRSYRRKSWPTLARPGGLEPAPPSLEGEPHVPDAFLFSSLRLDPRGLPTRLPPHFLSPRGGCCQPFVNDVGVPGRRAREPVLSQAKTAVYAS
jgi:hypothetical protein